jgi:cytochrome oxidase assembly protein ShyY1
LIQSLKDINETVDAVNATLAPKKQKMTVTKANRAAAAQYKVTAMLARPEMRKYYDQMARDAENAFLEEKAKRMLELAQEKKNMDSGIDQEQKKLEDNCKYDAVSQLQRVALQVLQIDMRIENGMLKIGDFKTDLPVLNAGKVMLGGHHLMDLPVVKDGSVQIGGTSIAPLPLVAQGQVLLPATVIAKALKIDLPLVNTPVTVGPVTIGAKDHGGLGVTVGNWKF